MPDIKDMQTFDYIISGAGCAGLSLAMRMIDSGKFGDKKILLVDLNFKKSNDRTWCYWEREAGFFEDIVFRRWEKLWFYSEALTLLKYIHPYQYKMIRGTDFYTFCLNLIRKQPNFKILEAKVESISSDSTETFIVAGGEKIHAQFIFNSIIFSAPVIDKKVYWLLQHFKGWVVESEKKIFNPEEAVLMDFRVSQHNGTAFVYIMPFSETRALIEYTFFTKNLLKDSEYDELLTSYLKNIPGMEVYSIVEKEFGIIPMTTQRFPGNQHHVINIGMAGGQTRASTGYTFQFIQKQTAALVKQLTVNKKPGVVDFFSRRFRYYDRLFLDLLTQARKESPGIFGRLFCFNSAKSIFEFLDAESSLTQDFLVISSLPKKPFLRSALRVFFHTKHA